MNIINTTAISMGEIYNTLTISPRRAIRHPLQKQNKTKTD